MDNIEKLLQNAYKQDFNISDKVEYRINYTLNNLGKKNNYFYYFKKISTAIISLFIIMLGSLSVYAAFGGTINGENIFKWLGINFSNEIYQKYKENINETIIKDETNVTLESSLCDEGLIILEFHVTLSKNDKEYLNIGEKVIPDDYIENDAYIPGITGTSIDGHIMTNKELRQSIAEYNKDNVIDKIWLSINNDIETSENGSIYINSPHSNMNIILNGNKIFARHNTDQIVNKISDYEYKVYQIYFLNDEKLNNQDEFEITMKDLALGTNYSKVTEDLKNILIPGEFKVKLTKNKIKDDTYIIYPNIDYISYNNSTQLIEKIMVTPMQTLIKITAEIKNANSNNIENYISPLSYDVFDKNGNKISSQRIETKKELVYSNGKVEEWPVDDIYNGKYFSNATIKLEEYILLQNNDQNDLEVNAYDNNNKVGTFNVNLKK